MTARRSRRTIPHRRPETSSRPSPSRRDRWLLGSVAGVLILLAAIADDRHVGLIADGRQMIRTAVAIAESGGIGQAKGRDFTYEREADGVSRFGMGTSLLQVPAAWTAAAVEPSFGPGSSQALFLIVPWLAVGVAAWAAGRITRRLGGTDAQVCAAVLLASLASPVASYAFLEFSEPVQAAALTLALLGSLAAVDGRPRAAVLAGAAAGFAVLTKSSLALAAPLALLPLVDWRDLTASRRRVARAALGAAPVLAVWAAFEFARFGRLFGGYPDDRFTHPWLDGFWRLLIGPNRGILLFWPALLFFAWMGVRLRDRLLASAAGRAWLAGGAVFAVQLSVAAGYWGWHGMEGWGPRLFLSALPLLAPFAALAITHRATLAAVVVVGLVLNLPPLLQHPTPVATYVMNLTWPPVTAGEEWRYPFYATARRGDGQLSVVPFEALEEEPAANPWRQYLWMWSAAREDDSSLLARLQSPPWKEARPWLVPPGAWTADAARQIVPRPRIGFLGRSLTGTGGPYATVYAEALLDQVVLANQQSRIADAVVLSGRRLALGTDGEAAAWRLETLRRAGRATEAESFLRSLPEAARLHPLINVALALFDRDFGEEQRARALLRSVAEAFPGSPVHQALAAPLASWPATLDAMTRSPRRDAAVGGPSR